MDQASIRRAVLGRLPLYLQYLHALPKTPDARISATTIAKDLDLGEVQVRKDLQAVSGSGRPKIGYDVAELTKQIEDALDIRDCYDCIIAGAGKLGRALLDYGGFVDFGVRVVAAFDPDPDKRGITAEGKEILPLERMPSFCKERAIRIGIITAPRSQAQSVCDLMVESGIQAIWNFAPEKITAPDHVLIHNENLALSLAFLKLKMSQND